MRFSFQLDKLELFRLSLRSNDQYHILKQGTHNTRTSYIHSTNTYKIRIFREYSAYNTMKYLTDKY